MASGASICTLTEPNAPLGAVALMIAVQLLHGVAYAFFFATLYIFIDAAFPHDMRTSAQGLFNLLVIGIGDLAAKWLFVPLMASMTTDAGIDYERVFLVPSGMAIAATLLLLIGFRPTPELSAKAYGITKAA